MKRIIIAAAFAVLAIGIVGAQDSIDAGAQERALERAGVSRELREKAIELFRGAAEKTALSRADLKIKEAELSKLLIEDAVDMAAVEKKLREISEIELSVRLNRIRTETELRGLIGDDRWAKLRKNLRDRAKEK